jgi:hypothetical protein
MAAFIIWRGKKAKRSGFYFGWDDGLILRQTIQSWIFTTIITIHTGFEAHVWGSKVGW